MAEDGASLPAHVCSCGISFGSILDPPDDNASDHCLTFPLGPSDLHKDWESDLQNDWGPANIVNPSEDWLDKLGSDLGSHNLTYLPIAKAGLDTKAGLDATDGCFSDVGFKIIKAATVVLLEHLIGDKLKEDCEGYAIDHPSQLQHSCLFDPPNFYFDTHFDELSGKLFNKVNEGQVFQNLYGDIKKQKKTVFNFKVGDVVRISKVRGPFAKGYEQNYTEEFFTVSSCIPRQPPVYRLKDYDGDVIEGVFYEEELQKIIVSKNKSFKVEKIVGQKKQGKSMLVLVKWLGWPSKFNSYIDKKTLLDLQSP